MTRKRLDDEGHGPPAGAGNRPDDIGLASAAIHAHVGRDLGHPHFQVLRVRNRGDQGQQRDQDSEAKRVHR